MQAPSDLPNPPVDDDHVMELLQSEFRHLTVQYEEGEKRQRALKEALDLKAVNIQEHSRNQNRRRMVVIAAQPEYDFGRTPTCGDYGGISTSRNGSSCLQKGIKKGRGRCCSHPWVEADKGTELQQVAFFRYQPKK